jgi:hypothetical protein
VSAQHLWRQLQLQHWAHHGADAQVQYVVDPRSSFSSGQGILAAPPVSKTVGHSRSVAVSGANCNRCTPACMSFSPPWQTMLLISTTHNRRRAPAALRHGRASGYGPGPHGRHVLRPRRRGLRRRCGRELHGLRQHPDLVRIKNTPTARERLRARGSFPSLPVLLVEAVFAYF